MSNLRWLALVLAVVLSLFAAAAGVNAQDTGSIKGTVVNRTPGGEKVSGVSVDLLIFGENGEHEKKTVTAAEDGAFAFADLAVAGRQYVVSTNFEGVTYYSEEVDLSKGGDASAVELAVYGTTTSGGDFSVSRSHLIVDYDTDRKALVVLEMMVIENKGVRTFVGGEQKTAEGKPVTLRIPLPEGATQVEFSEGLNELQSSFQDGVVVDTKPVPPGQAQIVIQYLIPYQESAATLVRKLDYPVERTIMLVRETTATLTAEGLPSMDSRDMAGTKYTQLSGDNLSAGQTISVNFANIPASVSSPANAGQPATTAQGGQNQLAFAAVALAGLGIVLGVGYPMLRRRRPSRVPPADAEDTGEGADEWDNLVEAIAGLDDEFEAGGLSEDEYWRQRAELKERLKKLGRKVGRS